ncbi:MAG TPA: hypothetical protein VFP93_04560, partial [Gammaproteobacteria bacterium]|nr:hypothetical protein [Gammaproteobacteria bacterium]
KINMPCIFNHFPNERGETINQVEYNKSVTRIYWKMRDRFWLNSCSWSFSFLEKYLHRTYLIRMDQLLL